MPETRYAYVARELASRIASGDHAVGSTLPKEIVLAEQFGVSRATVRSALGELQRLGLVSRKRNAGTRVEAARADRGDAIFRQSLGSIDDLVQYASETRRIVTGSAQVTADRALAQAIGVLPGRRLLHLQAVRERTTSRPPLCWTDLYVDAAFASLQAIVPTYEGLIGTLIEERFGRRIAEIAQSLKAIGVPARIAPTLQVAPEAHALEITRRYRDASGSFLMTTVSVHPADRFQYGMKLIRI